MLIDARAPDYAYTVKVSVAGWDRPDVSVEQTSSNAGEVRAEITRQGTITTIAPLGGIERSSGFFGLIHSFTHGTVYWTVHVPEHIAVKAMASDSPISVAGVVGALSLETSNGAIAVDGAGPLVDARTSNGRVHLAIATLNGHAPSVVARTENGTIDLRVPNGFHTRVATSTANGNIENPFAAASGPGSVSLSTMNGSITVSESANRESGKAQKSASRIRRS